MVNQLKINAPLRIDFCGGYSDLPKIVRLTGSSILNAAIDLYHDKERKRKLKFYLLHNKKIQNKKKAYSLNYKPIISNNTNKFLNSYYLYSEIHTSTGLGTSSSIAVMASYLKRYLKCNKEYLYSKCLLNSSVQFEKETLAIVGGIQDHIAAIHGGLNFIQIYSNDIQVLNIKKRDLFCDFIDREAIILFSKRNFSSSIIVKDIINDIRKNFKKINNIKNLNIQLFEIMKESYELNEIFNIIQKSWFIRKELSKLAINKTLNSIIELIKDDLYCYHSVGAGGAAMVIYPKEHSLLHINNKIGQFKLNGMIKCYYPKINWSGVQKC